MIYGYLRVSTKEQELDKDRLAILRYAKEHGLDHIQFIEEKESAYRYDVTKRKLYDVLMNLKKGDMLIAVVSSRLTRRPNEQGWILTTATMRGAVIVTIEDEVSNIGDSLQTDIMNSLRGVFNTEHSRKISQGVKRAYERFKETGVTKNGHTSWGKKPYDIDWTRHYYT
jgi:DNA invertase Pin-like site-specific DNA recombinase